MDFDLILRGIVLYSTAHNEYDKRLVVLTKERGKISVFANGARRPNSRLSAGTMSFTMGKFHLRESRNYYNLVSVEIEESFIDLCYDVEKMCYASYMCELTSYMTHEGIVAKNELNLLYVSFNALLSENPDFGLLRNVFELKILAMNGQGLNLSSCVKCGKIEKTNFISVRDGGLICPSCAEKLNVRTTSSSTLRALHYIITAPVHEVYSFKVEEEIKLEIKSIMHEFMDTYVDRKFNSLRIIEEL